MKRRKRAKTAGRSRRSSRHDTADYGIEGTVNGYFRKYNRNVKEDSTVAKK